MAGMFAYELTAKTSYGLCIIFAAGDTFLFLVISMPGHSKGTLNLTLLAESVMHHRVYHGSSHLPASKFFIKFRSHNVLL
jgi:hypothetical protein